jgi:hypothetical protein
MRAHLLWVATGILLTATCGGGSGTGPGGSGAAAVPAATCASLTCSSQVDDLLMNCIVSGSCTKQTTSTGNTQCFGNGVTVSTTSQKTSGTTGVTSSAVVSAKKAGAVCYTKTFTAFVPTSGGTAAFSSTLTITNGAGTTVATANGDASGAVWVTCPGGVPTKVDDACFQRLTAYFYSSGTPGDCTEGTCTF